MFRFLWQLAFLVCLFLNDNVKSHPSSDDLANLVSNLSPSVVNVFTTQKPKEQENLNQLPFDNIHLNLETFSKIFLLDFHSTSTT